MKKLFAMVLILLLILLSSSAFAADSGVCFVAINDNLLPLTSQAYSIGGQYDVPAGVFSQLRIYSSYHASANTLELTGAERQLFFNIDTGETYDSSFNYYNTVAVMRGSTPCVPVDFVCRQFGLSWSYIRSGGYGDVCRITDGASALSDELFLSAARPLMQSRYAEYTGSAVSPGNTIDGVSGADSVVFLSFRGLPDSDTLTVLYNSGVKATFLLTAREILSSPDTVRRIAGEGHNIGARCTSDPAGEFEDFSDALWETAHMTSVILASDTREYDSLCSAYAETAGLAWCDYNIDGVRGGAGIRAGELAAYLSSSRASIMYLRLQCVAGAAELSGIISALRSGSVILAAVETA